MRDFLQLLRHFVSVYLSRAFLTLLSKIRHCFSFIDTLKKYKSFDKVDVPIPSIFESALVLQMKSSVVKLLPFRSLIKGII